MKKYTLPLCLLLIVIAGLVSSCQEEAVEPPRDGNIVSLDDWQK
jgi:hypothetical protein